MIVFYVLSSTMPYQCTECAADRDMKHLKSLFCIL
jgi:hypothetical protein